MQTDYLIVGMGICGTMLSRQLLQVGKSIIVIDNASRVGASRCAGGILNPITGMRIVRSWMSDELIPAAVAEYRALEQELGIHLITHMPIVEFIHSKEQQDLFAAKAHTDADLLQIADDDTCWQHLFRYHYGIGTITGSYHLRVSALLAAWQQKLLNSNCLLIHDLDIDAISVTNHGVQYKNIHADKIIFCDGVAATANKWFHMLPFTSDKGEALIAEIPALSPTHIYKQGGLSIAPWQDGLFWIGAAHDWKYTTTAPTDVFKNKTISQLNDWLHVPYTIVNHIAALRPANVDRKPFVGLHPIHNNVGILNGMGGKGFSMAPYFAAQFAHHLTSGTPLMPHADVQRYQRVLSR